MKVTFLGSLAVFLSMSFSAHAGTISYATGSYEPWFNTTNDSAMNSAFGTGNWSKSNGFSTSVFNNADFVFLDGSDTNAQQFSSFLLANSAAVNDYVYNGGHLFLNAAPNVGGSFDFGFGVTLNYPVYSDSVNVTAAGVDAGLTAGGLQTFYTGSSFGHSLVSGDISDLIDDGAGGIVFGAKQYGKGFVAFGGQTTTNFHFPGADAEALLVNELLYVANADTGEVPEPASLALLGAGLIGFIATRRKQS